MLGGRGHQIAGKARILAQGGLRLVTIRDGRTKNILTCAKIVGSDLDAPIQWGTTCPSLAWSAQALQVFSNSIATVNLDTWDMDQTPRDCPLRSVLAFHSWFSLVYCLAISRYNYGCFYGSLFTIGTTVLAGPLSLHDALQAVVQITDNLRLAHTKPCARGHIDRSVFTYSGVLPSLRQQ